MEPQTPPPQPAPPATVAPVASGSPLLPPVQKGFFRGRLSRVGYLLGILYPAAVIILLAGAGFVSNYVEQPQSGVGSSSIVTAEFILIVILLIVSIPLSASINIRRWHDMGNSGWFYLLTFIPFASLIVVLIELIAPGTPGPNLYGDPYRGGANPLHIYGLR